jgi:hypothetical protein
VRERVVEIMHAYQTNTSLDRPLVITYPPGDAGPEIPQPGQGKPSKGKPSKGKPSKNGYADPLALPFLQDPTELARRIGRTVGKRTYYALRRVWTTTTETPRYRDGSATKVIGPPIEEGTTFIGEFACQENGEWWVVTKYRSHVRMTDLNVQIDLKAS